jgi:hypothetical protein
MQGDDYLDLVLTVGSTLIQLPVAHNSPAYPWLTIFQLTRFYCVILEIPIPAYESTPAVCVREYAQPGQYVSLPHPHELSLRTLCLTAPTRRPSEQSNHELRTDFHFVLSDLPALLV